MVDPHQGTDHFSNGVRELTEQQAKEQLQYELRDQLGELTFSVEPHENPAEHHGDGVVIGEINGEQADHYIYHEGPDQ